MEELEGIVQELIDEGRDDAFIEQVVSEWEAQNAGKQTDPQPQQPDATVDLDENMASDSEEPSSELPIPEEEVAKPKSNEEKEQERAIKEQAYRNAKQSLPGAGSLIGYLPDFLLEPYAAFESTLLGFGSGVADFASQQAARFDKTKYIKGDDGELREAQEDEAGDTVWDLLQNAAPKERFQIMDTYMEAGDGIRDVVDAMQFAEDRGTGSISQEFAAGNLANAAQLTVNQTASGLASLVPFFVPGGAVIGPAVLGTSAASGAFTEDLEDTEKTRNSTMSDIYNASYLKGGIEFGTELVTAGILGKARKLAAGGASKKALDKFTKESFRAVLGDAFSEGVSEGLADTGGRFVDQAIYGKKIDWKDATVGFIDSAIVGAIVGGKVATFGQLSAGPAKVEEETETELPEGVKAPEAVQYTAPTQAEAEAVSAQVLRPESEVEVDEEIAREISDASDIINE